MPPEEQAAAVETPLPSTAGAPPPAAQPVSPAPEPAAAAPLESSEVAPVASEGEVSAASPSVEAEPPKPSLLTEATTESKPVEPGAEPPAEPPVELPPQPTYEFTFPEGVARNEEAIGNLTGILGEHSIPQEVGQKLLDLHIAEMQKIGESMRTEQQRVFDATREEWRNKTHADLGNRFDTTLREAAFGRDAVLLNPRYGGSQDLLNEFNNVINFTGVGDHPVFIKAFAAIGRALAEPKSVVVGEPVRTQGAGAQPSRAATRYPNLVNGQG